MAEEERGSERDREGCEPTKSGYTIFLDKEKIRSFMESGDYSSSRELDHFKDVSSHLERMAAEAGGISILALSATDNRLPRDFAVLQMAHLIAKHGKKILIVDCDFLHPGLSGLVESVEDQGFLDILLYGSSLTSVSRSIGIDGVSVTGPGSFPVSKTIPFAQKEFAKVKELLNKRSDIVIYCSSLYTDERTINPLCTAVDGIILCCRIDEMEEGQLQRSLADLGTDVPPVDLVCFCKERERAPAAKEKVPVREPETVAGERGKVPGEHVAAQAQREPAEGVEGKRRIREAGEFEEKPVYIEKTEEIEMIDRRSRGGINVPRLVTVVVAVVIIVFIAWWFISVRTVRERETARQMTELVQKQRDVQEEQEKKPAVPGAVDTISPAVSGEEVQPARDSVSTRAAGEPQTVPEKPQAAPREQPAEPGGKHYGIHIASFKEMGRATQEIEYLKRNGFEARVVEAEVKGETWLRVIVGDFTSRESAQEIRIELLALKRIGYAQVIELTGD